MRCNTNNSANKLFELATEVIKNTKCGIFGFKYAFSRTKIDDTLIKPVYAVAAKTMKNWKTCDEIINESGISKEHPGIDRDLLRVLVADLLWGRQFLNGGGKAVNIVRKKKKVLKKLLKNKDSHMTTSDNESRMQVFHARVNTFKSTLEYCLEHVEKLGFTKIQTPLTYEEYLSVVNSLGHKEFMIDFHFNDLFVFHYKAKSNIVADSLFQDKLIVIQSKSSVIPVKFLNVEPGNAVLDMCAAPGMKTAIIASQLKGEGLVCAIDKGRQRYKAMVKNLEQLGVNKNIHCVNDDALYFKSDEIDLILLDAPCSGSGMNTRFGPTDADEMRLRKLQWVQMKLLTYALTAFPSVKRIVYSTCSIFSEENEAVIDEVIKKNEDRLNYELIDCHKMISGFSQGSDMYKSGPLCLKVLPTKDFANGFFVAVFDKISTKIEAKSDTGKKSKKECEDDAVDDQNKGIINESEDNEEDVDSADIKPEKPLKRKKKSYATFTFCRSTFKKTKFSVESDTSLKIPKTVTKDSNENVIAKSNPKKNHPKSNSKKNNKSKKKKEM